METKGVRSTSLFKPLAGSVYYLDVKPSKRHEQLKNHLRKLGAHLEDFLSKDVNYLVTDRLDGTSGNTIDTTGMPKLQPEVDVWLPDTPASGVPSPGPTFTRVISLDQDVQFPDSPVTDSFRISTTVQPSVQSRGQALLERAVKHKVQKQGSADVLEVSRQWGIKILPIKNLLDKLEKLLRTSAARVPVEKKSPGNKIGQKIFKLVQLHAPFVKVEDIKKEHRPFYRQLDVCPELAAEEKSIPVLQREDTKEKTKKPKLKVSKCPSSQREENIGLAAKAKDSYKAKKQQELRTTNVKTKLGYCEICSTSYTNLSKHVLIKTHATFMHNESNFEQLKELVTKLPTTASLRQRKRPLAEINQGNLLPSQKPPSDFEIGPAAPTETCNSSSPLIRRVNVVDKKDCVSGAAALEQLFSDNEDEYVEPSCSTADCNLPGCVGGVLCMSGPLYQDFPSPALPLQLPKTHCNSSACSCSSPESSLQKSEFRKPLDAHQSSSSTVPFISLDIQPLNLCTKRKSKSRDDKQNCSPAKRYKRQSDHVFFSENACVSVLEEKENCANAASLIPDEKENGGTNTVLTFSNLTFPDRKPAKSKNAQVPSVTKTKAVEHGSADVCSVRKVLFMSESNSPPKSLAQTAEVPGALFGSSDKSFSQCSLSEQMINVMSSESDMEELNCQAICNEPGVVV